MLQILLILKRKEMLQLTKEELKLLQDARDCYFCGNRILKKLAKSKNYQKKRSLSLYR